MMNSVMKPLKFMSECESRQDWGLSRRHGNWFREVCSTICWLFSAHIVYIWPALSHRYLSLFNELEVLLFFSAFLLDVNSSVWPQLIFWFQLTRSLFDLDRTNWYPFHSNKGPHVWPHNSALYQHVWNESIVSSSGPCEPGVFLIHISLGHMEM